MRKEVEDKLREKVKNDKFAKNLYRAFCNNQWYDFILDEGLSYSWRGIGGYVSSLRDDNENYMDFYCSGREGWVDKEVEKFLNENDIFNIGDTLYSDSEKSDKERLDIFFKEDLKIKEYLRDKKIKDLLK